MSTSGDVVQLLAMAGVGGVSVEVVRSVMQRRKMGADYADVIARSATSLLEPLAKRVGELEMALSAERTKVVELTEAQEVARHKALDLTTALEAAQSEVKALRREIKALRADNAAHPEGL